MKSAVRVFFFALVTFLVAASTYRVSFASDHEDGNAEAKNRAVDITDHFVFREDVEGGSAANLVFAQLSTPQAMPGQEYFFDPAALYEFHISRVPFLNRGDQPTGNEDISLRFQFSPESGGRQNIVFTVYRAGNEVARVEKDNGGNPLRTSSLAGGTTNNVFTLEGKSFRLFAGLRQDPAAFDRARLEQVRTYLNARYLNGDAAATTTNRGGQGPVTANEVTLFDQPADAVNFAANTNVNAIVIRVPISFLQLNGEPVFDTWSSTSVPK